MRRYVSLLEKFRDRLNEEVMPDDKAFVQTALLLSPDLEVPVLAWRMDDELTHHLHIDWYAEDVGIVRIHLDHRTPLIDNSCYAPWITQPRPVSSPRLKLTVLPDEVEKALDWAFDIFKAGMCWCLPPEGLYPVVTSNNPEKEVDYAWSTAAHAKYVAEMGEKAIFKPVRPKQLLQLMN